MQYFQAVKIGKARAAKSQITLFNNTGFAMITLTTKKVNNEFIPVGEEELVTVIKINNGYAVILVDKDGYTKAQSNVLEKEKSIKIFEKLLRDGFQSFGGKYVSIWTNKYTTIQNL